MGEEPLEDRGARVHLVLAAVVAMELVGELVRRPSVEAALDQAPRRIQGPDELVDPARMVEVANRLVGVVR